MEFFTLLTDKGKERIVEAQARGEALKITSYAVGDGGDGYHAPVPSQMQLVNEKHRDNISRIMIDPNYKNRLIVECIVPPKIGGFYIRELGLFDESRNLIAAAIIPESYKPVEDEGSTRDFFIKIIVEVENIDNVELVIDPTTAIASMDYIDNNHNKDVKAHYRLLDADKVDGYDAGNSVNQIPVSNAELCETLNADLLDGHHAGNEADNVLILDGDGLVPENNLKPYADKKHIHKLHDVAGSESAHTFDNMCIHSGTNTGTTTYVYPPQGFAMSDLMAFLPSINTIHFNGSVDNNDSLYCYWAKETNRVAITCYNTEQRWTPNVNWIAIWRKNMPTK